MTLIKSLATRILPRVSRCSFATSSLLRAETKDVALESKVEKRPAPGAKATKDLKYDERTHTGQAWDEEDFRLARFTEFKKEINPNIAMDLIAQVPPKACKERVVYCDGGDPALGHPRVFINLDKPGTHACGYCGLRFYKEGHDPSAAAHVQV